MSEDQLKAADVDATKEEEEEVEEVSDEDLEGVAGGGDCPEINRLFDPPPSKTGLTCCGHDPCLGPLAGCNSEATAD